MMLVRVLSIFSLGYFLSCGLRAINVVIAPQLSHDLSLTHSQLGVLSASYFIGFTALQLPLGVWLDRGLMRRVLSILLCIAAFGSLIFAVTDHFAVAALGRGLMGIGVAACFMVPLSVYRRWYHSNLFKPLVTATLCAGTAGVLSTTIPTQWFVAHYSWRILFLVTAALLMLAAALSFWGLRQPEIRHDSAANSEVQAPFAWQIILRHPQFMHYALVALLFQGGFNSMQSLWLGPWLVEVVGQVDPALYVLFLNSVLLLAYLFLTALTRYLSPKAIFRLMISMLGSCVCAGMALGFVSDNAFVWMIFWSILFFGAAGGSLIQTEFATHFSKEIAGRANTAYNIIIFGGGFLIQAGLGFFIDGLQLIAVTSADALRYIPPMLACFQSLALISFVRKPR